MKETAKLLLARNSELEARNQKLGALIVQHDHDLRTLLAKFGIGADEVHRPTGTRSPGERTRTVLALLMATGTNCLVLDEPTEGIQPSIIKDIGRAIDYLRDKGNMAILLVEQYFEFARDLADDFFVMDRGAVVLAGARETMVEQDVRRHMSV